MTGDKDDFGARFADLLSLYCAAFKAVFFHLPAHGHGTATAAAAIVVIPLMFHWAEIFRKILSQLLVFLRQPTAPDHIAGILDGGGFLYLPFKFYAAVPYIIVK